ncbi:RluA family pseudouridine synthase OS=Streptomyces microflavus OX=1919 GN=HUT09_05735 PE=4 SV=1 [Streptomyces microflavus]
MRGRRKAPAAPLPQRDGIDAVRVRLPEDPDGAPDTSGSIWSRGSVGRSGATRVAAMLDKRGAVAWGPTGGAVRGDEPYTAGRSLWFHRDFAAEEPVPFPVGVVYRDAHLVIADKPHFLATTPRGRHITETAVARLRRELGLPALQPAHRLDRLTAGLVLFVVRPEERGAYQTLFRDRLVRKEYEAVAPYDPELVLPGPYGAGS